MRLIIFSTTTEVETKIKWINTKMNNYYVNEWSTTCGVTSKLDRRVYFQYRSKYKYIKSQSLWRSLPELASRTQELEYFSYFKAASHTTHSGNSLQERYIPFTQWAHSHGTIFGLRRCVWTRPPPPCTSYSGIFIMEYFYFA